MTPEHWTRRPSPATGGTFSYPNLYEAILHEASPSHPDYAPAKLDRLARARERIVIAFRGDLATCKLYLSLDEWDLFVVNRRTLRRYFGQPHTSHRAPHDRDDRS